jgi:hypothetical protein
MEVREIPSDHSLCRVCRIPAAGSVATVTATHAKLAEQRDIVPNSLPPGLESGDQMLPDCWNISGCFRKCFEKA